MSAGRSEYYLCHAHTHALMYAHTHTHTPRNNVPIEYASKLTALCECNGAWIAKTTVHIIIILYHFGVVVVRSPLYLQCVQVYMLINIIIMPLQFQHRTEASELYNSLIQVMGQCTYALFTYYNHTWCTRLTAVLVWR